MKNTTDFITKFEEEVRDLVEQHYKAKSAFKEVFAVQAKLTSLEAEKNAAAEAENFSQFAKLMDEADNIQSEVRRLKDEAAAAMKNDSLTPELVAKMQAAFTEQLDAADRADVEKMLPHIKALREVARDMERRNSRGVEAIRELNRPFKQYFIPQRNNDAVMGVKELLTSKTIRKELGEDPAIGNPAFVEL